MPLSVIGIRHHSPACAGLVTHMIEELKPKYVLIEGPADMNRRISELLLPHRLPIAIFSYRTTSRGANFTWAPMVDYSPEWAALKTGHRTGARVMFIDLPGWSEAFAETGNRFADRLDRTHQDISRLCQSFQVSNYDALWDHLFEQPLANKTLQQRLTSHFQEFRQTFPITKEDRTREAFMGRWVAWAMKACEKEDDHVVVVCGGFHAPYLESCWQGGQSSPPEADLPPEDVKYGTYLVPYSFFQMDAFSGYNAGMPSPGYYQAIYEQGMDAAADRLMEAVAKRLREARLPVSTADLIAARSMAKGLQLLRGHRAMSRIDLLDGLAAALVKEGLYQPLPWSQQGKLPAGTDPLLVEIVALFSGDKEGVLARGTPLPPLVAAVKQELDTYDLTPDKRKWRRLELDLTEPLQLQKSRILHRLDVLNIPGFTQESDKIVPGDGNIIEEWQISWKMETEAALIKAGAYGSSLDSAAQAILKEKVVNSENDPAKLADVLIDACFTGIDSLSQTILLLVRENVNREQSLSGCSYALGRLLELFRYDTLLEVAGSQRLGSVIAVFFERCLWLYDTVTGPNLPADSAHVEGARHLRDTLLYARSFVSGLFDLYTGVMVRRMNDSDAPPALRGAALGALSSSGFFNTTSPTGAGKRKTTGKDVERTHGKGLSGSGRQETTAHLVRILYACARPEVIGDFLYGLFALAREEFLESDVLLKAVDRLISKFPTNDFLCAVPALRMAFEYFTPMEKEIIAGKLVCLHKEKPGHSYGLLRLEFPAETLIQAEKLEQQVIRSAGEYGIQDLVRSDKAVPGDKNASSVEPGFSTGLVDHPPGAADAVKGNAEETGIEPPILVRWRLILGQAGSVKLGLTSMHTTYTAMDAALSWLYDRDPEFIGRGIRRTGGQEGSALSVPQWINRIHTLFPKKTIERLETDAVERYQIEEMVTNIEVLKRVEPSTSLMAAVLRTKHLMNPEVLAMARELVKKVVRELMEKLASEVRKALSGVRDRRRRSFIKNSRNFDIKRTIRENLLNYHAGIGKIIIKSPYFYCRSQRHLAPWQLIIMVDQSGSMASSVIHSAVSAACFWGIPSLKTHLCTFDTSVVDLSDEVTDPVSLLMQVQLGGGTDIAQAMEYAADLVEVPKRTIVVLITDFFEGGNPLRLLNIVKGLSEQGTHILGLAALDEQANPEYNRDLAQKIADAGAHVAAMTPGELAAWVVEVMDP